ncbi:hypothetical protein BOX37_17990 [Nocardia mangyaensis]|uniref:Uncharacterized protein n=1 Tax=Nocardia mangyaensis TaxID=2213200 RepID=A0A1J0VUA8_9NOCA|nr:hypothetical protein [Nocardia mangyaensis]APE35527.1 hypothetical protein BOX37_17990 [Nocardia mangyaensis]
MQIPHPPILHFIEGRTSGDAAVHDTHLVVQLHDAPLRALCARAAGLSPQALLRLTAAAETLRRTEGLAPAALTSQW